MSKDALTAKEQKALDAAEAKALKMDAIKPAPKLPTDVQHERTHALAEEAKATPTGAILGTPAQRAAQEERNGPAMTEAPVTARTVTFVMPGDTPPYRVRNAVVVSYGFRDKLTLDVATVLDEDGLPNPYRYRDIEHDESGRPGTWHD